jgi:hypothetical protein
MKVKEYTNKELAKIIIEYQIRHLSFLINSRWDSLPTEQLIDELQVSFYLLKSAERRLKDGP